MKAVIEIEFLQANNEQVIRRRRFSRITRTCTIYSARPIIWTLMVPKRVDWTGMMGSFFTVRSKRYWLKPRPITTIYTRGAMTNAYFSTVFSIAQYTIWKPSVAQTQRSLSQTFIVTWLATHSWYAMRPKECRCGTFLASLSHTI